MSLVPVLNGSMNWQAWQPMMMNYLLSQGQWKVILNKFPAPDYKTKTTVTKPSEGGSKAETVDDTSKPPKNQSEIDSWFDVNNKALGNIMLRLHPTIATTVLNLLQKTVRADLGGHLKYSRRWSGVRAGVLLGAQGAVHRGENRGEL